MPPSSLVRPTRTNHLGAVRLSIVVLLLLASTAFFADTAVADTTEVIISMQDIDCQSCGTAVSELLRAQNGVESVRFEIDEAELVLALSAEAPAMDELLALIERAGYTAVAGAGAGRYLPPLEFPEQLDMEWISRAGEAVDVKAYLVEGKVTVIDFYAVWCGPCRKVDAAMKEILAVHDDVALRKINVVDWSSPIAKQELKRVSGLPYVEVYGKNGKRVASIDGLDLDRLRAAIEKGRQR